eukprot:COSAG01_NODE_4621_length_4872_cov_3.265451_2_plen_90_part_00
MVLITTIRQAEAIQTIEQDLPRTFPLHVFVDTEEVLAELRRVLVSYSLRNPGVVRALVISTHAVTEIPLRSYSFHRRGASSRDKHPRSD